MIEVFVSKEIESDGRYTTLVFKGSIDTYKDYYKYLECSTFDVVRINYKGHDLSIFVDDDGMVKQGNYGRIVFGYDYPLFGAMVLTGGINSLGETLPIPNELTLSDIKELISDVRYITN